MSKFCIKDDVESKMESKYEKPIYLVVDCNMQMRFKCVFS